jgi:hypothetical protein
VYARAWDVFHDHVDELPYPSALALSDFYGQAVKGWAANIAFDWTLFRGTLRQIKIGLTAATITSYSYDTVQPLRSVAILFTVAIDVLKILHQCHGAPGKAEVKAITQLLSQ